MSRKSQEKEILVDIEFLDDGWVICREIEPKKRTVVYMIVDENDATCKIGVSDDPGKRLSQLQTAHPLKLRVEAVIPIPSRDLAFVAEAAIHKKLDKFRLSGEWFRYSDYVREFFLEYSDIAHGQQQ